MDDLAQTVMDQMKADDGPHPNLLLATWKDYRTDYWDHFLVHPITKNGTTSYNVEKARHNVNREVHDFHLNAPNWRPDKVCNFATSLEVANFLFVNAKARHDSNRHGDRACLNLTVGPFGKDLFNQSPMEFFWPGPVNELINMLGWMRPTVEEE